MAEIEPGCRARWEIQLAKRIKVGQKVRIVNAWDRLKKGAVLTLASIVSHRLNERDWCYTSLYDTPYKHGGDCLWFKEETGNGIWSCCVEPVERAEFKTELTKEIEL